MSFLTYDEIGRAKKNIKDYEQAKTFGNILNGSMLLTGAGAAIGGFTGNNKLMYPAMGGAFISGFLKARVNGEEQHALNKMKSMYDIRRVEKNLEKKAMIAGAGDFASALVGSLAHTMGLLPNFTSFSHSISDAVGSPLAGAAAITLTDLATITSLANIGADSTRSHAYVAAKDTMGKALNASEKSMRGWSTLARSEQLAADAMAPEVYARVGETLGSLIGTPYPGRVYGNAFGKGLKATRKYFGGLLGPLGSGGKHGETAGKVLHEVEKWSPRYSDLGLGAIKSDVGVHALKDTVIKDVETLGRAGAILNSTIDEIPLARKFLNATGRSGEGLAKKIIENPESAVAMANDFKHTVQKSVSGGKSLAIATGLMGAGYMLGTLRKKHPLSQNELPSKILG